MLFNSLAFLIFASLFFIIWPFIYKYKNPKWIFLVLASFFFYGWWDWRFIFLIIFSGLIDFFSAAWIQRYPAKKKFFLVLSICVNVGLLVVFKYLGFLTRTFDGLTDILGLSFNIPVTDIILPIGISFYTFQSMSYTIDVYKGKLEPTQNIFHFFAYLALFPQLVAGPIIRASKLLPQIKQTYKPSDEEIWDALKLIVYGFFKKIVVADNLGVIVDTAFQQDSVIVSMPYWWIIISFFAIQIYCDFAGYSDIARGLGKLMGYDFPVNFNHPYISRSLQEFWTRWHISLSSWFRDYLYYPLLQKRMTEFGAHRSMWITMIVSGLWHGASWTFIIWGALHAFYYSLERLSKWPKKISRLPGGKVLSTFFVIILVWIAWVFFRSESLGQAIGILKVMLNLSAINMPGIYRFSIITGFVLTLAILRELSVYSGISEKIKSYKYYPVLETVFVGFAIVLCIFLRGTGKVFIYFQF